MTLYQYTTGATLHNPRSRFLMYYIYSYSIVTQSMIQVPWYDLVPVYYRCYATQSKTQLPLYESSTCAPWCTTQKNMCQNIGKYSSGIGGMMEILQIGEKWLKWLKWWNDGMMEFWWIWWNYGGNGMIVAISLLQLSTNPIQVVVLLMEWFSWWKWWILVEIWKWWHGRNGEILYLVEWWNFSHCSAQQLHMFCSAQDFVGVFPPPLLPSYLLYSTNCCI